MTAVVVRAPTRLDFGGGWTDVPPYSDEIGGCVCNLAIARYARVALRSVPAAVGKAAASGRDQTDLRLARAAMQRAGVGGAVATTASDFPIGAGLGGSSAVGVALTAATAVWRGAFAPHDAFTDAHRATLAEESRATEVEDAGIAGGRQDHYAAAFGGALRIDFGVAASGAPARAHRLAIDAATRAALEARCIVVYTGQSRISGDTIEAVLGGYRRGERRVVHALARMGAGASQMADALLAGDVDALGALVAEQWMHQRALHPSITTETIDALTARAPAAGALGTKPLGASGGGCVLLVAAAGREDELRALAREFGALIDFTVDDTGVTVERANAVPAV